MNDPNIDEFSVMTYLSQFPRAKLKQGAPKLYIYPIRIFGKGTYFKNLKFNSNKI